MKLIDIEKLNLPYYNEPDDEYEMQFNEIMQEFAQRIKSMETVWIMRLLNTQIG